MRLVEDTPSLSPALSLQVHVLHKKDGYLT